MIITKSRKASIKICKIAMFSIFNTAHYLNSLLLSVAYPHNVLSHPGSRRQMRVCCSCALEKCEVDKKTAANRPVQRRDLGPVKKVCGCSLVRFCAFGQNEARQVGLVFEKMSDANAHTARRLMHLGGCNSVPSVVANTALRTAFYLEREKKGRFRV
jgi:hypothetical protein